MSAILFEGTPKENRHGESDRLAVFTELLLPALSEFVC
jgi:hypothetical protein